MRQIDEGLVLSGHLVLERRHRARAGGVFLGTGRCHAPVVTFVRLGIGRKSRNVRPPDRKPGPKPFSLQPTAAWRPIRTWKNRSFSTLAGLIGWASWQSGHLGLIEVAVAVIADAHGLLVEVAPELDVAVVVSGPRRDRDGELDGEGP